MVWSKLDVGKIIAEEGAKEIREKFQGTMVSMFLKDDLIKSVAEPIGDKVGEYIRENGRDKIHPIVVGEIAAAESRPICQWFEHIPLEKRRSVSWRKRSIPVWRRKKQENWQRASISTRS